jgi:hypothetical protein
LDLDPRVVVEGIFSLAAFFCGLWIKGVRDELRAVHLDLKETVKTLTNHGERIAVLESKMEREERR